MKKLGLSLDDLRVDSFDTSPERTTFRGTVRANGVTDDGTGCTFGNCGEYEYYTKSW
jgi:hypothetical protein